MPPLIRLLLSFTACFCLSCRDFTLDASADANPPQKITVYKENVYDLSGYADEGGGDPFNLFDENAFVNPLVENKPEGYYVPHTSPQPGDHPFIYFPAGKGSRIVIDLATSYKLTDIFLFDRSASGDSVWIYTGNMTHWRQREGFTAHSSEELGSWRRFELSDSTRYVMIRFSSWKSIMTEMVLYGYPYGRVPPPPVHRNADPPFAHVPMKEFLGVNDYNNIDSKWYKPFFYTRMYTFAVDYDPDTDHQYPQVQYDMLHFGYWNTGAHDYSYPTEDNVRLYNHKIWYTMQALPKWMIKFAPDGRGRPVTSLGMDPEDPMSYARHAGMMWTLAAWFGHNKVDTGLIAVDQRPRTSGRGTMDLYENGSEEDATWIGDKYQSPLEYFAQSSADYDGAEHRLPPTCGIMNADTASRLMTAGLIGLDTNRLRVYKFLCRTLRKDKAFLWKGGVQLHYYSTNYKHGLTPEEDSLRWRLARVRNCIDGLQPGTPCILGENGYDKSQSTRQSTPLIPGLSKEECQAIFVLRSINATAFSGFDAYILYWLKDAVPPEDPTVYLTSGVVRLMPDGSVIPYPSWWYVNTFVNRLADYAPDAVVSEKGNVWVYRYRNQRSPDSVAYFVYAPTHNGAKVAGYPLRVGAAAGGVAQEIGFMTGSTDGNVAEKKVIGGIISIDVEEKPILVLLKTSSP
jgi:hypothetical protein